MLNSLCITPNFYRHEGCAVIWFKTTLTTQRENTLRLMRWFTWSKLILIKWIRSSLMKSDNDNKTLIKTDRDNVWFVQTDKSWCLIRHQLCPPNGVFFSIPMSKLHFDSKRAETRHFSILMAKSGFWVRKRVFEAWNAPKYWRV